MYRDTTVAVNAGGVLMDKMLGYVSKQTPYAQEKRGDIRLDEARTLIVENERVIDTGDLQVVEQKIIFAREMKSGLDSKWGLSKFLQAREFHKAAKSAYHAAKTASDRGIDGVYFARQRPDASTSSIPEMLDRDRATRAALSLCKIYQSCKDAFPTPQMKVDWITSVWREACEKTGANPNSFEPYYDMFADGNIKLFTDTKARVMHIVESQYGFNTSHAPDSISSNAALAQGLLSRMAFAYQEPNPGGSPHHLYQHPALQKVINMTWFQSKVDDGVTFHEHFSPLSIPAIAFVLTVIECCIDEWTDGTRKETEWGEQRFNTVYQSHITSLAEFRQEGIDQGSDLFEHIRSVLVREARKHAGVPPVPVTELGRLSREALHAAHEEGLPTYTDQDIKVPEIKILDDSDE